MSCNVIPVKGVNMRELPLPGYLLQPLATPEQVGASASMDFIEGLSRSEWKDCILVVMAKLTKFAHFIGLTPFPSTRGISNLS